MSVTISSTGVIPEPRSEHCRQGRPTKYTARTIAALEGALEAGVTIRIACDIAGIGEATYFGWARDFPEFSERSTRARAIGVVMNLSLIRGAAERDWRAAAWLLEHCHPEHFGRRAPVAEAAREPISFTLRFDEPRGEDES